MLSQGLAAAEQRSGVILDVAQIPFLGSTSDLRLAVKNLVENAIRFSEAGGTIQVRTSEENGYAVLVVRDTGRGIPARDLPRIFERFYRVDSARSRDTGGTGLGLAIVKHVADRHDGRVEVESDLGAGSTFTMILPVP